MQLVPLVCAPTMLAGEAQTKGCPILDLNTNKASSLFSYGSCVTVSWLTRLYRYVLACPMPRSSVQRSLHVCTCVGACLCLEPGTTTQGPFMTRPELVSYPWRMLCGHIAPPLKPILCKLEVEVAIGRGHIGSCGDCQWAEC